MRHPRPGIVATILISTLGSLAAQQTDGQSSRTPLELFWDGGLRAESKDGKFKIRLRARFENDWGFMDSSSAVESSVGSLSDGTELRRMRLGLQGRIYENIPFKAQVDFASGDAEFRSVYAGVSDLPVLGNLRIGNQREPFGLERNTGTHYVTMMERASANALTPKRNTGILAHDSHSDDRFTWAVGFFRETNDQGFGQGDDGIVGTARVTGIPWLEDDSHFLHLGVSMSRREFGANGVRFKARPGLHLAPSFVDTSAITTDHGNFIASEALWMMGATSLQVEHFEARTGGYGFQGSYVQLSHFLTRDHRRFRRSFPQFIRVKPNEGGAWELTGRASQIDLNDGTVRGGKMKDYTLGLNWYSNPNVRIMANMIYADLDSTGGALMFALRFGIDF